MVIEDQFKLRTVLQCVRNERNPPYWRKFTTTYAISEGLLKTDESGGFMLTPEGKEELDYLNDLMYGLPSTE